MIADKLYVLYMHDILKLSRTSVASAENNSCDLLSKLDAEL